MKILILLTLLLCSSTFANCNKSQAIGLIEDHLHQDLDKDEKKALDIYEDIDYALHQKVSSNLEVINNETQHTYTYSQQFKSVSEEGLACKEIFIVLNCSVANIKTTHMYYNCKK